MLCFSRLVSLWHSVYFKGICQLNQFVSSGTYFKGLPKKAPHRILISHENVYIISSMSWSQSDHVPTIKIIEKLDGDESTRKMKYSWPNFLFIASWHGMVCGYISGLEIVNGKDISLIATLLSIIMLKLVENSLFRRIKNCAACEEKKMPWQNMILVYCTRFNLSSFPSVFPCL